MKLTVKLFAMLRESIGFDEITLTVPTSNPTVEDLRSSLLEQHPGIGSLLPFCQVAVNHEIATDSQTLQPTDEIAILPPFSGG